MADQFNSEINVGPPPLPLRKRRSYGALWLILALLVIGGAGSAIWLGRDHLDELAHLPGGNTSSDVTESAVSAADFAAFQQQTGSALQSSTDTLAAQQAELKRLSDQIQSLTGQVAALTAKLDQPPATVAAPAAAPAPPVRAATGTAPRPPAHAVPHRRPADRPAGAISVGGAPLPAPAR